MPVALVYNAKERNLCREGVGATDVNNDHLELHMQPS
jgi:hypothetical protein